MDVMQYLYDWYNSEIYVLLKDIASWLTHKLIYWKIQAMIFSIDVAFNVASMIIADLGLAERLSTLIGKLSVETRNYLNFFNVFTGIQWIIQSLLAKFVLKFMGL